MCPVLCKFRTRENKERGRKETKHEERKSKTQIRTTKTYAYLCHKEGDHLIFLQIRKTRNLQF